MATIGGKKVIQQGSYSFPALTLFEDDGAIRIEVRDSHQGTEPQFALFPTPDGVSIVLDAMTGGIEITSSNSGIANGQAWQGIFYLQTTEGAKSGKNYHLSYTIFEA